MLELHPPALQLVTGRQKISLDSPGSVAFVSHAHSDHAPSGKKAAGSRFIASKETMELLAIKGKAVPCASASDHYDDGHLKARLLDSGHILGSKQLFAEWDSTSFVYSGDFKLEDSLTCPRAQTVQADAVLVEATYGVPRYVFPPREQVYEEIASWVRAEHAAGHNVLLGGYAVGKAQELVAVLNTFLGITPVVTKNVSDACQVYARNGVKLDFVCAETDEGKEVLEGGSFAAVAPMNLASPEVAHQLTAAYGKKTSPAVSTGWALNNWFKGAKSFCLSDHADHAQLLEYVELTGARKAYTTHGFARELAEELRKKGIDAEAVEDRTAQKAAGKQAALASFSGKS
ncbi:MAG: hypothetical protein NTY90_05865 [Candidatus Micrarchaeota archaeon]|nr:hypothetical protein [Candidatus Micrarchaeota archaeon]